MSALDVLPVNMRLFVDNNMQSESHRRMFHIGAAVTKIAAMFGTKNQHTDAMAVFVLLIESMENHDPQCEDRAMRIYDEYLARRRMH